jgi:2-polyprenyl-6-hydroxyphenyl methylase/3-demethylubiquinone-9 3-methyltransferase
MTIASQISSAPPRCKVCGSDTVFFDRCDFHNNIKLHHGFFAEPINASGVELDYHRCTACGFLFSTFMDDWDSAKFSQYVYNRDYPRLDGSYNGARSGALANILYLGFHEKLKQLDILDYGGGSGITTSLLSAFGAKRAITYDPFAGAARPTGKFNIVSCFEVAEHAVDQKKLAEDLMSFTDFDNGFLFMGTEFQPEDVQAKKKDWWYMAPRVGHISFHTKDSYERLFAPYGLKFLHIEHHTHIGFKKWPLWAHDFFPPSMMGG